MYPRLAPHPIIILLSQPSEDWDYRHTSYDRLFVAFLM